MGPFDKLVEEKIVESMQRGEFDNLPGKGKPLDLDEDAHVPRELRMAYRMLKRAGIPPEEVLLQKEVSKLRLALLDDPRLTPDRARDLRRRLLVLECESNIKMEQFKKRYTGL